MHALIVDDDALNRSLLRRMLARSGWSADEAEDGLAAVEACKQKEYDLVLLDLQMPGISGYQAAGMITGDYKARPEAVRQRPRLVAVTGADRKNSGDFAGFDGYLQKPFMLDELKACLNGLASSGNG